MARVFVAMAIPVDAEADLAEHLDGLRSARPDLRWTQPSTWHLTLQFIGECGNREVDRQIARWEERAARVRPMTLCLAGAGAFPSQAMARVLWAGVDGDMDEWRRIAMPEQEPHVTLARVRPAVNLAAAVGELSDYRGPDFTVDEIHVMESHLRAPGARGPRHTTLATIPLHLGSGSSRRNDPWS